MSALQGVKVLDLTGDPGRFATKLLTEFGADVVRVTPAGSPGHSMTQVEGGVLDWWFDGGKQRHRVDLDTGAGQNTYRLLASSADVIVETETPGRLADLGLDHSDLLTSNPGLVQVSITPFGPFGVVGRPA